MSDELEGVFMKRLVLISLAVMFSFFFLTTTSGAVTVIGIVYIDANKNREYDRGEKGVKGVAVSNGESVIKTDRKAVKHLPG
jgi:hypothetical protein